MSFEGKSVDETIIIDAPCDIVWQVLQALRTLESGRRRLISYENGEAIVEEAFLGLPVIGEAKVKYRECEKDNSEIKYSLISSDKFKIFEGTWKITPADGGKTKVRLTVDVDPGVRVPFWKEISHLATTTLVNNRFKELANRASKMVAEKAGFLAALAISLTLSSMDKPAASAPLPQIKMAPKAFPSRSERDLKVRRLMQSSDNNFTPVQVEFLSSVCQGWAEYGRQTEARAIMQRVLKSKNAGAHAYCTMGQTYLNEAEDNGELEIARKYINQAIKRDPNFSQAYFRLAVVEQRSDHCTEALRLLDKALSLKDPYLPAWSTKAGILSSLGRSAEAYKAACQAEKLMPNDYNALCSKAGILAQIGKQYEAALLYKRIYDKVYKSDYILHQQINCLDESRHYEEALAELKTLITLTPADGDSYRQRAGIYRKMKNYDAALKDMNRAVELEPSSVAFKERAKIFELMGKSDKARVDVQSAAKFVE